MNRKKTPKSRAAKSVRDLPAKAVSAKTAKNVKGGGIPYATLQVKYWPQKPDGTL
jgi:hypothetical protein